MTPAVPNSYRTVFYVSDGTAITTETVGHAVLSQFERTEFKQVTVPFVDSVERAQSVVASIERTYGEDGERPIVFSSLADAKLLKVLQISDALVMDLFDTFARQLEDELNTESTHTTGRIHAVADKKVYDTRIDAVHFALHHDDGASTRQYQKAQVILVGVSRSGKTPTSLYLAMQFGIQAANYPLTEEDLDTPQLPKVLREFRANLFGLTIDPDQLANIRQERRPNSRYASIGQCRSEVEECEQIFRRFAIPYVDTTTTSIEEISSKVIHTMGLERRLF
jgi:[pyruvate, water dikinase]-phosphate phosphotransferase / [pyruvate, water dikinase] kinase